MTFTLFGNLNTATGSELDVNFSTLGTQSRNFCTIGGTNALTFTQIANTPVVAAYSGNLRIVGVAAATNTTAVTATLGSLGVLPVVKDTPSGPVALTGGEIVVGNLVALDYDSTLNGGGGGWHLLPPVGAGSIPTQPAIAGSVRNLKIGYGSTTILSVTADEVIVQTALGGTSYVGVSISHTLNTANVGANGMDQTGTIGTAAYLAVYEIYNPTTSTFACLGLALATTAASPTIYAGGHMPAGFTASSLIGIWPANDSGSLVSGLQYDRHFWYETPVNIFTATTLVNSLTSQSISPGVPAAAKTVDIVLGLVTSTSGVVMTIAGDAGALGSQIASPGAVSSGSIAGFSAAATFNGAPINTSQTIYWAANLTTSNAGRMSVTGYTF